MPASDETEQEASLPLGTGRVFMGNVGERHRNGEARFPQVDGEAQLPILGFKYSYPGISIGR